MALEPSKFLHRALSFLSLSMVKHQDLRASNTCLSPWPFNKMPFANIKFPGATAVNSFQAGVGAQRHWIPALLLPVLPLGCLLYPLLLPGENARNCLSGLCASSQTEPFPTVMS